MRRLHIYEGIRLPTHNVCPGYYTKASDGEAPVLLLGEIVEPLHCHYSLVYSDPER